MGLDVYLYRYEDFEKARELEEKYSEIADANWETEKKYEALTESEKEEIRLKNKEAARELGLDEEGDHRKEKIEIPSAKYPDHYFKVGYFRSSYNESGLDRVTTNACSFNLRYIFGGGNDYYVRPNWAEANARLAGALSRFREYAEKCPYRVTRASWNEFSGDPQRYEIDSEAKALGVFREVFEKHGKQTDNDIFGGSFSNDKGIFHLREPLPVVALIQGVNSRFFVKQNLPCTYIVYRDTSLAWDVRPRLLPVRNHPRQRRERADEL